MKIVKESRENGSLRVKCFPEGKSMTQQHMADATDINRIMARYLKNGGSFAKLPDPVGMYADLTQLGDFQESMNVISKATFAFQQLPANFRQELNNDPQQLINFLNDPENRDRAVKMGLMKPVQQKVETKNETKNENKIDDKLPEKK